MSVETSSPQKQLFRLSDGFMSENPVYTTCEITSELNDGHEIEERSLVDTLTRELFARCFLSQSITADPNLSLIPSLKVPVLIHMADVGANLESRLTDIVIFDATMSTTLPKIDIHD